MFIGAKKFIWKYSVGYKSGNRGLVADFNHEERSSDRIRDTSYTRPMIALFSCPLSWIVHYNFAGDGSCRLMVEAVRMLTVAVPKQDFSARKLK